MISNFGYNNNLFILPFDHRSSFVKLFGFTNLGFEEKNYIKSAKQLIYEAFKKAVTQDIPKDQAAILIDEEYGDEILKDAINQGFITALTTEKSGQEGFNFEYGEEFAQHIEKYRPTFVKALIRYQPHSNWTNLKLLSDHCHMHGYKFLLEMLMEPNVPNAQNILPAIIDLRDNGLEPDVWKLEGMENKNDYKLIVAKIQEEERQNVGLVILGRGESKEKVEQWIITGRNIKGVIGFAVGRTVFSRPLIDYKDGKVSKEKAIEDISSNFQNLYKLFISQN